MVRFWRLGTVYVCCTMFFGVFGIESEARFPEDSHIQQPEQETLQVVEREDDYEPCDFDPCELDLNEFFGEVESATNITRNPVIPQPVWRSALMPAVLWAALWYERIEYAVRRSIVIGCQMAERLLGCDD